jgi:histidyl-tRNA synthetase
MDKIGIDGVSEELIKMGFAKESVDKYLELFREAEGKGSVEALTGIADKLGDFLSAEVKEGLTEIINSVDGTKAAQFEMEFDPTLVRGMSYYTGTIFEVAMPQYGGSCGGGGRYDKMVGKFLGQDTPACGFSIGFERIIMIMMDEGFKIPGESAKVAYLIEKGIKGDRLAEIIAQAQKERAEGKQVLVVRMNKNKKFQKQQLTEQGYEEFKDFYENPIG